MIYFIQGKEGTPIKIGFSETEAGVGNRLRTLQTAHAYPLRILRTISGDVADERKIHSALARDRLLGEWFDPSPRVLRFVRSVNSFNREALLAELGSDGLEDSPANAGIYVAEAEVARTFCIKTTIIPAARRSGTGPKFRCATRVPGGKQMARYYKVADVEIWLKQQRIPYHIHKPLAAHYFRDPANILFVETP